MAETSVKKESVTKAKTTSGSKFVYVIYIRTTQEKLWDALTKPEFTKRYWCETWQDCDWKQGSSWKLMIPDGRVGDAGEIIEIEKPKRFVLTWRNEFKPELTIEGYSRCTFDLETALDAVRLTITHEIDHKDSKLIDAVSNGWPMVLSSLKSLLETGESIEGTRTWPKNI
jgi:uncharacterized protein YndB with AHSA1/START domain